MNHVAGPAIGPAQARALHLHAQGLLSMPRRRVFAAYLEEARSEVLRYLRNPGFLLPII